MVDIPFATALKMASSGKLTVTDINTITTLVHNDPVAAIKGRIKVPYAIYAKYLGTPANSTKSLIQEMGKTALEEIVAAGQDNRAQANNSGGLNPISYTDHMEQLKGERLGYSHATFDSKINYFNISMLPDYDNAAEPYFAFILMSRPSLRLNESNMESLRNYPMTSTYVNDYYGNALLKSISQDSNNVWVPLITTQAKSYSVNDTEIKTVEKGATFYGHTLKYGKHSEDHKISGTMSIDFRNDRFLSILKMMQIWMGYIYLVSKTDMIEPLPVYQKTGILDYAGSIYYLVTRRDMRELVYWEKLTGVFPLKAPYSIFNYSDGPIIEDSVSIEFAYGPRSDPNDPAVLLDINALTGAPLNKQEQKMIRVDNAAKADGMIWDRKINGLNFNNVSSKQLLENEVFIGMEAPFTKGDIYATTPYITAQKNENTGTIKYFLHWLSANSLVAFAQNNGADLAQYAKLVNILDYNNPDFETEEDNNKDKDDDSNGQQDNPK